MIGLMRGRRVGQIFEIDTDSPPSQSAYGFSAAMPSFISVIADDAPLGQIDQEHAARLQSALRFHHLRRNIEHAHLGRHDDQIVLGDIIARRPQPIAIEDGADAGAVGEGDRRRAVPRLHQARMIFVKRLLCPGSSSDRRAHGSGIIIMTACGSERPARTSISRTLSNIAESLPVSSMIGRIFLISGAEQVGGEHALAGVHPVDVAAQRVDFAVVADVAIRMGPRPGRERVGAESRMHQCQRRLHRRVEQIGKIFFDLRRVKHALVDQCACTTGSGCRTFPFSGCLNAWRRSRPACG